MSLRARITKAVIPAAGKGTRLLPLTRSVPKEMLPLGRKPVIHHVVDELLEAGMEEILFVISEDKSSLPAYFAGGPARLCSVVQREQRGLADAVLHAESFANGEPVLIALGDTVISSRGQTNVTRRLLDAYQATDASCMIAVEEVPPEDAPRYGIVHPVAQAADLFEIDDLIEKPEAEKLPSNLAIGGRYVVGPAIYDAVRRLKPGALGELQLTDAIRLVLAEGGRVWCVRLRDGERRRDIGTFWSYYEAVVSACCEDEELAGIVRDHKTTCAEEGSR